MSPLIEALEAVIFDMDGVLVDSEPLHFEAYKSLIGSFGGDYDEEFNSRFLGRRDIEIAPTVIETFSLPHSPEEFVQEKDLIFYELIKTKACALPGVLEALKAANQLGLKTAIASSSKMTTIDLIVDTLDIRLYFNSLTSGDHVKRGKPEPDIFLLAAEKLTVAPQNCLVIEDTDHGVQAAKGAGMHCIAIPCTATLHQKHEGADARLSSMVELDLVRFIR